MKESISMATTDQRTNKGEGSADAAGAVPASKQDKYTTAIKVLAEAFNRSREEPELPMVLKGIAGENKRKLLEFLAYLESNGGSGGIESVRTPIELLAGMRRWLREEPAGKVGNAEQAMPIALAGLSFDHKEELKAYLEGRKPEPRPKIEMALTAFPEGPQPKKRKKERIGFMLNAQAQQAESSAEQSRFADWLQKEAKPQSKTFQLSNNIRQTFIDNNIIPLMDEKNEVSSISEKAELTEKIESIAYWAAGNDADVLLMLAAAAERGILKPCINMLCAMATEEESRYRRTGIADPEHNQKIREAIKKGYNLVGITPRPHQM